MKDLILFAVLLLSILGVSFCGFALFVLYKIIKSASRFRSTYTVFEDNRLKLLRVFLEPEGGEPIKIQEFVIKPDGTIIPLPISHI